MRPFIEIFTAARAVATPTIAIKTFDSQSTIRAIKESLGEEYETTPLINWDSLHGIEGINKAGGIAAAKACADADIERPTTIDLAPAALLALEQVPEDAISFLHNAHLFWNEPRVIQGVANLRDKNKGKGALTVLLMSPGEVLPSEFQQDVLVLDDPLPSREQLGEIVKQIFQDSAEARPEYKACKDAATPAVIKATTDALVGLPAFPSEQAVSMDLNKLTGEVDYDSLWGRKRSIISQMPGLSFQTNLPRLADMHGNVEFANFANLLMTGKKSPTTIIRMDEIEKQFAGNATDSSGDKGNLLGEWLTWVNDYGIICSLLLGVPGSSKSWATYCIAGEHNKPCVNYSVSAIQDKHVGQSAKHQRNAHTTLNAISDNAIWLIATANTLNGLPPEMISRFQLGGIWFFDAPEQKELEGIMRLKIAKYKLDPKQPMPAMEGWTGRDVDNCARRADLLGVSLAEAGKRIIPLMRSNYQEMQALRESAHDKYLSATKAGTYQCTVVSKSVIPESAPLVQDTTSRKMR